MSAFDVAPADAHALRVAAAAFDGLKRGAATGDWSGFTDLLTEDVRLMIPVPATIPDPPEGVLHGIDVARQLFGSHHEEQVDGVELTAKRVSANGNVVVVETRVEGVLNGESVANYFVFAFEVADDAIAAMYEYAVWNGKHETSRWTDRAFAREAFA